MSYSDNILSYSEETLHTPHITTMYCWDFLKMFLVNVRRSYIQHSLLRCTAELFWKFSQLFWGNSSYISHYCYVQLSFFENVLSYSQETVHTDHITTTYSWGILKLFLVILRGLYIILTLLIITANRFWKMCYIYWGDCTYCSQYYQLHLMYYENQYLFKPMHAQVMLLIAICTVMK